MRVQHCVSASLRQRATERNENFGTECLRMIRGKKPKTAALAERPQHNTEHIEHHIKLAGFRKRPFDERLSTFWHTHRPSLRSIIAVAAKHIRPRERGPERGIQTRFYDFSMVSRCTSISPKRVVQSKWIPRALHHVFVRMHDGLVVVRTPTHPHTGFSVFSAAQQPKSFVSIGFSMLFPMDLCVEALSLIRPLYRGWRVISDTGSHFSVGSLKIYVYSEVAERKRRQPRTEIVPQHLLFSRLFFLSAFFSGDGYMPRSSSSTTIASIIISSSSSSAHRIGYSGS